MIKRVERTAWVFLVAALIGSAAVASVLYQGPFFITDSNGTTQVTLGTGAAGPAPGGNISLGKGTLVLTDTNLNNWGQGTGQAQGATTDITVTFGTAEPETAGALDNNYQIMLATDGITPTAGAIGGFTLGDKYPNGFAVRNQWKHNSSVRFTWYKFRTTTP